MIDITGIKKTAIYENRLLRRQLISLITETITKTGRVDSADVRAYGALLPVLDREIQRQWREKK